MKEHLRLTLKEIKKLDPAIEVEVSQHKGHFRLQLVKGRRTKTLSMSGTPTNTQHTINAVMRDVKKYFLEDIDAPAQDNIH